MKSINLIPKKRFAERFFWPTLLLMLLLIGAMSLWLVQYAIELRYSAEGQKAELQFLQNELATINKQLQRDTYTVRYDQLARIVDQLHETRKDWPLAMQQLTEALPRQAMMIMMRSEDFKTEDEGTMTVRLSFARLEDVHVYVQRLLLSDIITEVVVDEIVRNQSGGANLGTDDHESVQTQITWDAFMTIRLNL